MMSVILALSVVVQIFTVITAVRIARITGRQWAWLLILCGLSLMIIRRLVSLSQIIYGYSLYKTSIGFELFGLGVSLFIAIGLYLMIPVFKSMRDMNEILSEKETSYKSLINLFPEIIAIHQEGKVVFINDKGCTLLGGRSSRDFIGRDVMDFVHPGHKAEIVKRIEEMGSTQTNAPLQEEVFLKLDGTPLHVEVTGMNCLHKNKPATLLIARDITKQLKSREQILKTTADLEALFEAMPDLFFRFNKKNQITDYRVGKNDILYTTPFHFLNKTLLECLPNPPAEQLHAAVEKVHHTRKQEHVEYELSSGEIINYYEAHLVPLLEDQVIAVVRNITHHKTLENNLRESRQRFKDLADLMPETVYEMDSDGTLTYLSKRGFELFGFSQLDFENGINIFSMLIENDKPKARESFELINKGIRTTGNVYNVILPSRKKVPIMTFSAPIREEDTITGYRGILLDISEQRTREQREKELQSSLDRAKRMESIGLLASGVAHDLNNILGPIVGYPDIILDKLDHDSSIRLDVLDMQDSARRAAALIKDLLTLSRRGVYKTESLDIQEVIRKYLQSASHKILLKSNASSTVTFNECPEELIVDVSPSHFTQVLMNLIINAFEAMPDGGSCTISVARKQLDKPIAAYERIQSGHYAVLSIKDTGTGIAETDIEHIMEPFFSKKQLGRSGSGLGLAVVYGVIKDFHGYIDVQSEPGQGTEFILYLPLLDTPCETDEPEASKTTINGNEKLLIVDDEETQRRLGQRLLSKLGYKVTTAPGGKEAVEMIKANTFHLVILDMIMNEQYDGLRTFREIKKLNPNQKCIIASGFSINERVKAAQHEGAGIFIQKPYTLEEIGKAVRAALDK